MKLFNEESPAIPGAEIEFTDYVIITNLTEIPSGEVKPIYSQICAENSDPASTADSETMICQEIRVHVTPTSKPGTSLITTKMDQLTYIEGDYIAELPYNNMNIIGSFKDLSVTSDAKEAFVIKKNLPMD